MTSRALIVLFIAAACHRGGGDLPEGDVAATIAAAKPVGERALDPATLHGKPSIVIFVSPTCKYCLATIPRALASAQAHDVPIVAVFTAGRAENARGIIDYTHFSGTALVDDGTLVKKYKIHGVPYSLVLGPDGHAREALEGEQDQSAFDDALAKL